MCVGEKALSTLATALQNLTFEEEKVQALHTSSERLSDVADRTNGTSWLIFPES